jgi:hypothetical protein
VVVEMVAMLQELLDKRAHQELVVAVADHTVLHKLEVQVVQVL